MDDSTSLRVAMYIGPLPFGSIDVEMESDRPSNLASSADISEPILPPPITIVSEESVEEEDNSVNVDK
jgi:hypothetical protein